MHDAAKLAFAISPLLIVLFAYEMSAVEYAYGHSRISEKYLGPAIAAAMLKLPASLVAPVFAGWPGFAAIAALDVITAALAVREDVRNVKGLDEQA